MQTNLLWTGTEYHSLENCIVTTTDTGSEINSVIIGISGHKIYKVEYLIKTNRNWETIFFEIKSQFANTRQYFSLQSEGRGYWTMQGKPVEQFNGCMDIDIPLTPFTNTLPINRLKLSQNEKHQIKVVYIDILEQQIKPVSQNYIRLSATEYKYENVPNDFEAVITVDECGLVVNYPELFVRTARQESNYH